jgi:hypothetical protein
MILKKKEQLNPKVGIYKEIIMEEPNPIYIALQ